MFLHRHLDRTLSVHSPLMDTGPVLTVGLLRTLLLQTCVFIPLGVHLGVELLAQMVTLF